MTDEEAYQVFVENYGDAVKEEMRKMCHESRQNISRMKDSDTKQRRLSVVDRKEHMFPGLKWFVGEKPPETKLMGNS